MLSKTRFIWLCVNTVIGIALLIDVIVGLYRKPVHARIQGNHILYGYDTTAAYAISPCSWSVGDTFGIGLYIYLIISTMCLTSARGGLSLGVISSITLVISIVVFQRTWTSIWCFFEAIVSVIILLIIWEELRVNT